MARIFISYSRRDKVIAETVAAQLHARGATVFIDYQKLLAGENFITRLGKEIELADTIILLVSKSSVESKWVQAEIVWAFSLNKQIIPAVIEDASFNKLFVLVPLEQVDLRGWSLDGDISEGIRKLARALDLPVEATTVVNTPSAMSPENYYVEEDIEPNNSQLTFTRESMFDMFTRATEIQSVDPDGALFLLRQVVDIDPTYLNGAAKQYKEVMEQQLTPARIERRLQDARQFFRTGQFSRSYAAIQDAVLLDGQRTDARRMLDIVSEIVSYAPLYEQAHKSALKENWQSVKNVTSYIIRNSPNFGDPSRLWSASRTNLSGKSYNTPRLEWIKIPQGRVRWGKDYLKLSAFMITKYRITNTQFNAFIVDPEGYRNDIWWSFSSEAMIWHKANPDPSAINWTSKYQCKSASLFEVLAFCRWLGIQLGAYITIPTELHWIRAARGDAAWFYPWGNKFRNPSLISDHFKDETLYRNIILRFGIDNLMPISLRRDIYGASIFGIMNMIGERGEMCWMYSKVSDLQLKLFASRGDYINLKFAMSPDDQGRIPRADGLGFRLVISDTPFL